MCICHTLATIYLALGLHWRCSGQLLASNAEGLGLIPGGSHGGGAWWASPWGH